AASSGGGASGAISPRNARVSTSMRLRWASTGEPAQPAMQAINARCQACFIDKSTSTGTVRPGRTPALYRSSGTPGPDPLSFLAALPDNLPAFSGRGRAGQGGPLNAAASALPGVAAQSAAARRDRHQAIES